VDLIETGSKNVNWIDVAEERVYWRGFVKKVTNQNYLSFAIPVSASFPPKKVRRILGVVFTFIQLLLCFEMEEKMQHIFWNPNVL